MKRTHDRFEALAGALALDEATAEERAEFEAHAAGCALCAQDAGSLDVPLRALVEKVSANETWRPSVADDVGQRIADSRQRRWRMGLGTLGYAVAASLVLNVLFVTGFAGRAIDALRVTPEDHYAATQSITIEHRRRAIALAPARLNVSFDRYTPRSSHPYRERPQKTKVAAVARDAAASIAGLSIWAQADAKRDVAQIERCRGAADAVFASEEPCPSPNEAP